MMSLGKLTFPGLLLCTRHSSSKRDPEKIVTCALSSRSLASYRGASRSPESVRALERAWQRKPQRGQRQERGRHTDLGGSGQPPKQRAFWLSSQSYEELIRQGRRKKGIQV